jgi:hypothetical protein
MKKKMTPFAVDNDNVPYVRDDYTGIHPLVRMFDVIPCVRFGKEKHLYYRLDIVIAWHEKELSETNGRSGNRIVLKALKTAAAKHAEGKCYFQD